MITTRRSCERTVTKVGNIEEVTLGKAQPVRAYDEYKIEEQVENEQERARRFNDAIARNFENLLNFRKDDAPQAAETVVAEPDAPVKAQVAVPVAPSKVEESDLCPSSTTMQFKGEKAEAEVFRDIHEEAATSYKINTKGKLLIAVYALVIVTLFALIILNTRALKSLDADIENMNASVAQLQSQSVRLTEDLEYISSDENIMDRAENELNMIRPD